jgi:hypothetical protein
VTLDKATIFKKSVSSIRKYDQTIRGITCISVTNQSDVLLLGIFPYVISHGL